MIGARAAAASLAVLASCAALALEAADARAHTEPVAGANPFVVDGVLVGGGTTWGVALQDDDGVVRRVCEESVEERPRFFHRARDGRVLVGSGRGLLATTDGGCTYDLVPSLAGRATSALAVDPADPARLFVATSTGGAENGVFASDDEGLTFEPLFSAEPGVLVTSVVRAASGAVFAAGLDPASGAPRAWAAVDGTTFVEGAPWPAGTLLVRALGVDADGRAALGTSDEVGGGHLLLAEPDLSAAEEIGAFDAVPTAFAAHGGARFVVVNGNVLLVQGQGGWVQVEAGPSRCLLHVPGDARLWGCGQLRDGAHFLVSADGLAWEPLLPYGLVEDRLCPEDTVGRRRCAYLFEQEPDAGVRDGGAAVVDDAGSGDGERPRPPGQACACAASPTGAPLLALAAAALLFAASARRGRETPPLARRRRGR